MTQLFSLPLFWAALTIAAFLAGQQLYRRLGNNAFIPPILTGVALVVSCLELSGVSYQTYMLGGDYLNQMLGPVVVMLAVPLYQFIHTMRKQWLRIALAVTIGSGTTIACAVLLAHVWIGDDAITRTIYTKSITTPVALAISDQVGGISALASAFVIITGILGALMIPPLLKLLRMDEPQTLGLTLGICAHAIGTSRALELGPQQSAYAAMAMTLTATLHALVLPWIV
ncbi:MAG: LrgB family protein [Saccharospirillaceae bacterium]|nr:LrgB family protein [Saccharospirillaceae bacterium]MCD8531449.1 LrgB family protein [Saccharospirillaceae bacterium]